MQKVYSHPDLSIIHLLRNALENAGIRAIVRGEYGAFMVGAGTGIDAWNELWIADADRTTEAIRLFQTQTDEGEAAVRTPWTCASCGEELEGQFAVCWNCDTPRPKRR
jgi:hypothetical protein